MSTSDSHFFLSSRATSDAIKALSRADNLMIYCGAGVSIDRTGMGWMKLISSILMEARNKDDGRRDEYNAAIALISSLQSPEHCASVVTEILTENQPDKATTVLFPILQDILYRKTWSSGYLLRNTVRLAITAAAQGRGVTIITTNYDIHFEQEFIAFCESLRKRNGSAVGEVQVPGLRRRVLRRGIGGRVIKSGWQWVSNPGTGLPQVDLIYLHGRVPGPGASAEGIVVLDEHSYALTHRTAVDTLVAMFEQKASAALILGASLSDQPLVHALIRTKAPNRGRYAVFHGLPRTDERGLSVADMNRARKEMEDSYRRRGQHLGLEILYPLGHFQSAQFVEEIELACRAREIDPSVDYFDKSFGISYAARLEAWSTERASTGCTSTAAHEFLADALEEIEKVSSGRLDSSFLRLEFWGRLNPRSSDRTLTLFSNSAGPLINENVRRKVAIDHSSRNASVRAFLAGKPTLSTLEDLSLPQESSRWRCFIAMPIFLQVSKDLRGSKVAGSVPVGVITLAGMEDANLQSAFLGMSEVQIKSVKALMIATGRKILRPMASTA